MVDYLGKRVGNYTIAQKLGDGGFATVWLAQHTVLEKKAAVKFLLEEWIGEPDVVSRFFDEAKTMERLKDHPHIVGIIDIASPEICDKEGVPPYFIMEYVDGRSIEAMIHSDEAFSLEFIVDVAKAGLSALDHCHKLGVVHRDIKPSNILVTTDGRVKLTDFGIAKAQKNTSKTGAGLTLGSTDYMSPEQALGKRDLDHRSDIYSFGVTLYEMVVGQLPFIDDNPSVVALAHIQEHPKAPREYSDIVPEGLNYVIMKGMEKDPDHRFQSSMEMLEAMEKYDQFKEEVEMDVPTVDISTDKSELPEDQFVEKDEPASPGKKSAIHAGKAPPGIVNAIRFVLMGLVGVGLLVGAFFLFQNLNKSQVSFEITPVGAEIFLDQKAIGTAPITLTLEPRTYHVSMTMNGYSRKVMRLDLSAQQNIKVGENLLELDPTALESFSKAISEYESAKKNSSKENLIREAEKNTKKLLAKYPDYEEIHSKYFSFCSANELKAQGESFYSLFAEKVPNSCVVRGVLGKFQLANGKKEEALNSFAKAWKLDPNSTFILNSFGDYYLESDPKKAMQYYEMSLFLEPEQKEIETKVSGMK